MLGKTCVLAVLLVCCNGFLFGKRTHPWDGLKVTWGVNVFSSIDFADMPREESSARSQGWTKLSDCKTNTKFLGARYIKGNDAAVILIYDVNGYIAGIQAGVASDTKTGYPHRTLQGHPFVADGSLNYITAYFVNPSTICSTGRTAAQFQTEGTGTNLYIQNGTDPVHNVISIPHNESAIGSTKWKRGYCFPAMGVHYWYNVRKDMSCDEFFPVFLLYNGGELNAFGWAFQAALTSQRVEHPPKSAIQGFMNPVPDCIMNSKSLSTLHIYMNSSPRTNLLCD